MIKKKISVFLARHSRLNCIQKCLRKCGDKKFAYYVSGYMKDPDILFFEKKGEEYPDRYFYDIYIDCPSKGFFALLNQTIDALKYAKRFNITPVITWSDRCLYKESNEINGSVNPFNYYYEMPDEFTGEDIKAAAHVLEYNYYQRSLDRNTSFGVVSKTIVENNCYDQYIEQSAQIYREFIKLKQPIVDMLESSKRSIRFEGKILGVHVRATDFKNAYVNHAVAVEENEYIDAVHTALIRHSFDKIFLATDERSVVENFKKEFGDMVIFCNDVFRSSDGNAVHFSSDGRENHKYKLGLEVIRDMQLLAECDGIIGGYSNVCITAQIVKKSKFLEYEYINIIDKGFNSAGKTCYQDHKNVIEKQS